MNVEQESTQSTPHEPLHTSRVDQPLATINRLHILSRSSFLLALFYYRASHLPQRASGWAPLVSWALLLAAELIVAFFWILLQAFRWKPISRTAFPERLPPDHLLPPIDVFICTADPEMEPTVEVMNTLISATCLDYPADRLAVYVSDDGGSLLTLHAAEEAYAFAAPWRGFCERFGVDNRCPEAYFSDLAKETSDHEFLEEQHRLELMYEALKDSIHNAKNMTRTTHGSTKAGDDRPPHIQVIQGVKETMPLLVYVSREKKKSYPHYYKAGALNVLLRVSSIMSNSPYILVLDCDMYCNNPTSARQAMCFHLDPHLSPSLAFVQFPLCFRNISKNDIYCAEIGSLFKRFWKGCDALRGPMLSGTGFYIKRDALYGTIPGKSSREEFESSEISELKLHFGSSNKLIASIRPNLSSSSIGKDNTRRMLPSDATFLAAASYEVDTQWGEKIGFLYGSVVEDFFTGFQLHCRGWTSTYYYPKRQAFLGSVPININDTLIQNKRWASGLLEVGLSRFCPLTYGVRRRNSVLESMCYAWVALWPLQSFALLCYGIVPQLCFVNGISLFPPVSSPWFALFVIMHASFLCQLMVEIFLTGGTFRSFVNEVRFSMILHVTSSLFACLSLIMKLIGIGEIKFDLTNKVTEGMQIRRYENGIFDFEGTSMVLFPLTTIVILNVMTLVRGVGQIIVDSSLHLMFGQLILSLLILIMSYPILEGIFIRRDGGRVPGSISLLSVIVVVFLFSIF